MGKTKEKNKLPTSITMAWKSNKLIDVAKKWIFFLIFFNVRFTDRYIFMYNLFLHLPSSIVQRQFTELKFFSFFFLKRLIL